jgi:hypothetical protein
MLQALRSLRLSRLQRMLRSAQVPVRALSPWLMRALTPQRRQAQLDRVLSALLQPAPLIQ